MTKPDTSREAAERLTTRLMEAEAPYAPKLAPSGWCTVPDDGLHPDAWRMLDALLAERDALQAKVEALQSAQSYTYIGKDGRPVLACDLEEQRDALEVKLDYALFKLEDMEAQRDALQAKVEALRELERDSLAEDFNEHWESAIRAQSLLAKLENTNG